METVELPCGAIVQRYRIIGTDNVVYQACRPLTQCPERGASHSAWWRHDERWYGRVGTDRLPPELDALPAMSLERSRAVDDWHAGLYDDAYRLIVAAFPGATGRRDMGEIHATEPR